MSLLKTIAARLPSCWQAELKRIHAARQIKKGTFLTDEPEYDILHHFIGPGDWVIDIGANVGYYTKRFSELVGDRGRVIAFEPVPTTFSLLSANAQLFAYPNVTLINAAVSEWMDIVGIDMPKFSTGLTNYCEARITSTQDSSLSVLTIPLDSLFMNQCIALVKIDVEGHESFVIGGMQRLIERQHPVLIVETSSENVVSRLNSLGYVSEKMPNSPNVLFKPEQWVSKAGQGSIVNSWS
jgi:FkbM family methyltransferase